MTWHLDHAASGNRVRLFAPWCNGSISPHEMRTLTRHLPSHEVRRQGTSRTLWLAKWRILLLLCTSSQKCPQRHFRRHFLQTLVS